MNSSPCCSQISPVRGVTSSLCSGVPRFVAPLRLASFLLSLQFPTLSLLATLTFLRSAGVLCPVPPLGLSDVFLLSKTGCGSWGGQLRTPSARLTPADGTSLPWPRGCLPVLPLQSYPFLLPLLTSAFGRKVTMCRPWVRSEGSCFASWGRSSYINHLGFCTGGSSVLPTY